MKMRVCLVGCGEIAGVHARFLHDNRSCKIVGLCDVDRQRAQAFAKRFSINRSYTRLDQLLQEQRPDVVHVLTPPQTHASTAIAAMEAGCHVFVEKPMALSVEEADAMIAVAKANGVKLCVNHNQLFDPVVLRAFSSLRAGVIGDVVSVESHYGFNFTHDPDRPWIENLPGGIFQNLASHPLYLILELLGDPVEMHVSTLATGVHGTDTLDELRVILRGQCTIGNLAISLGTKPNLNFLRICGTKAILHADLASKLLRTERLRAFPKAIARGLMNVELGVHSAIGTASNVFKLMCGQLRSYQGTGNLIRAFYKSLEEDRSVPVSEEAARRVVAVFDQILQNIQVSAALSPGSLVGSLPNN